MWIVIEGTLCTGWEFHGPFKYQTDALDYAEGLHQSWEVTELTSPASEDKEVIELRKLPASERIESLAKVLIKSFLWKDTPQGDTYWQEVYRNLLLISNQKKEEK